MQDNLPMMDDRNKDMPEKAYNDEPPTPQDQSRRRMLKGMAAGIAAVATISATLLYAIFFGVKRPANEASVQ